MRDVGRVRLGQRLTRAHVIAVVQQFLGGTEHLLVFVHGGLRRRLYTDEWHPDANSPSQQELGGRAAQAALTHFSRGRPSF